MNWRVEVKREKDVFITPSHSLFCHRNNNMAKQIKFLLPQISPYIKFNFGEWV